MKFKVEQTHDSVVITIPTSVVWTDPFIMMTMELLKRYDPAEERQEYNERMVELMKQPMQAFIPSDLTGN